MPELLALKYIDINLAIALQVILLGFIVGTLSGFIGSGGAFFMTPGMMNLGVEGVVAVASNITHKFGKAMVGSRSHGAAGNVDKRLAAFLLATAIAGIQLAVWINVHLFKGSGDGHGAAGSAGANLYISMVFVLILSVLAVGVCYAGPRRPHGEDQEVRLAGEEPTLLGLAAEALKEILKRLQARPGSGRVPLPGEH